MYTVKLAALAENAIRDGDRNGVSLINIIENMTSGSFPVVVPRVVSVWMLTREPTDASVVKGFELVISLGDLVQHQIRLEVNFQERLGTRVILTLDGYVAPTPGILTASLRLNGAELGRYAIPVLAATGNAQTTVRPT